MDCGIVKTSVTIHGKRLRHIRSSRNSRSLLLICRRVQPADVPVLDPSSDPHAGFLLAASLPQSSGLPAVSCKSPEYRPHGW